MAKLVDAHRCGPDEGRDIGRDPAANEIVEVLAERRPCDFVLEVGLLFAGFAFHRFGERPHGPAFAEYLQRDTLTNVRLRPAVDDE